MERLLAAQRELHGRIARTCENLKKSGTAKLTPELVQSTLSILETRWAKFEAQHDKLLSDCWQELKGNEYLTNDFMSQVEVIYVQQRAKLLETERALPKPAADKVVSTVKSETASQRSTLPRIQLPQFSGKYEDWPSFRDLFSSIVVKDAALSNVERLHYLKTSVKGGAEQLIRNLPSTEENFTRAWSTLTDHYENKRMLVRSYLSTLTSLQKMKPDAVGDLRKIFHGMVSTVGALEGIGRPITNCMDQLVHIIVELLDTKTRREWEGSLGRTSEPPSYEDLRGFLQEQLLTHEALRPAKGETSSGKPTDNTSRSARSLHVKKPGGASGHNCPACSQDHFVMSCDKYRQRTAKERRELVEAHRLCTNCLGRHQVGKCKSQKTCTRCAARHHTTLHDTFATTAAHAVGPVSTPAVHTAHRPSAECSAVLLATARVLVTDRFGVRHATRALVDSGSETSLVSESLAQRLRIPRTPTAVSIFGVGGVQTGVARGRVTLNVTSRTAGTTLTVSALVLPRLTAYSGAVQSPTHTWPHIRELDLADPDYWATDPIELLLGADAYAVLALPGLRRGGSSEPIAQHTTLGWIILGPARACQATATVSSLQCSTTDELNDLVRRFWEQEEAPIPSPPLSPDDMACEEHFSRTHSREPSGRYMVRLPTRPTLPDLFTTRRTAQRMLEALIRRFPRDRALCTLYTDFLSEYIKLGHMSPVEALPAGTPRACYLPHHGVLKGIGDAVKIRVVFNGSSRAAAGQSLNDGLYVGPNLLPALFDVVLRWRRHRYVVAADIEKMYRQIMVHPDDRDLQRILWTVDERVQEYQLNTITYGLASAPYLAIRTLRQLADDEGAQLPLGAEALRRDTYMDDVLSGASTLREARLLRDQLSRLCTAGGFPLRKWTANDEMLLHDLPPTHRLHRLLVASLPSTDQDILGIRWYPEEDSFAPSVRGSPDGPITKRSVLAQTARLFDPLGWLAPIVVRAKLLIQTAWLQRLEWDVPLPEEEAGTWKKLQLELPSIEQIRIPRWIRVDLPNCTIEVHGFADASERAYAAVVYLRTIAEEDTRLSLLLAKTRVAPLKQVSIPRLELCAATLLTRLVSHTMATLSLREAPVHLWTDSTVVLGWIRGHPTRWTTYVANRVSEIQRSLPEACWHHVPGKDNPADCASRGTSPKELLDHHLWWRGPKFLEASPDLWPTDRVEYPDQEVPEKRPCRAHIATERREPDELTRFSSSPRLLRVTAWMLRWRTRGAAQPGLSSGMASLSAEELTRAHDLWVRLVQTIAFPREKEVTTKSQATSSALRRLSPFKDERGLLRIGDRLKHSGLGQEQRHPIILPHNSHFTYLLVAAHHRRTLHGGTQLTLASLRQRYWVLRGRQVVKSCIHRCLPCLRWRAATPQPQMGHLPRARVTPSRPFIHTGVDFAGPVLLRTSKGRGHKAYKAYISVFVCFSSRAVHLEVVSDYSADAFLAAFRRFVSRRGLCGDVYSDCGTNFVGADRQLRELFRAASQDNRRIVERLAVDGIRWHFNPPAAPHFGGLWEAAVKATKHHLRRVIGESTLTYEEMAAFLAEVEACLNSRPLQALSDDPEDLEALTPGHLLIGAPLTALPEPSLVETPSNQLTRWRLLQQMRDHMWQRWSQEYIQGLTPRPKWWTISNNLREGQLCLLKNEATPPSRWPLARIVRVHPGDDGQVRVVTVRTAAGELRRPVVKIVPLPAAGDCDPVREAEPATNHCDK